MAAPEPPDSFVTPDHSVPDVTHEGASASGGSSNTGGDAGSARVAINFAGVSKEYGEVQAVHDLDLKIFAGELVVLLGPSGCGKTTTLRMINRLILPTRGVIEVNGRDVASQDLEELRRGIGYVIQAVGLFPHLTVGQNVQVVPRLLGWPMQRRRERAYELLTLVGLEPGEYYSRYPRDLSGGQQQRVGVARALAADPPVLLMDEPFGAVDPLTRARLQDEFLNLQQRLRKTVVFVTHDLDEAVRLADRICLMREGSVEQFASPERLLAAPATPFVRRFVGSDRALKRLGRLTVDDVMRRAEGAEVMISDASLEPDQDVRSALGTLLEHGAKRLPVLGAGGELLGELRLDDIVALSRVEGEP